MREDALQPWRLPLGVVRARKVPAPIRAATWPAVVTPFRVFRQVVCGACVMAGLLAVASCGGDNDADPVSASVNAAAESGLLYARCVRTVRTSTGSAPAFSRRQLLKAVPDSGSTVVFHHNARPIRGARLGSLYGVPLRFRHATVRHSDAAGNRAVTIVSHRAAPAMVAGYLRCEGYRQDEPGRLGGSSWSRRSPSPSFVRALPGAVIAARHAADVQRVVNRLTSRPRS